jgi:hypothetical protein
MKDTLVGYRDLIERERADALEAQFRDFMGRVGIDPESGDLRPQFLRLMEVIADDSAERSERIAAAIESDFLYSILAARSGASHREMRTLTRELSRFVSEASRNADNEQQFVQNLIAGALRELADDVERPTRGQPGSDSKPSDFWTDAVRIGLDALLNP